ncbi:MAG: AlpA family phage regulatory protein [Ekhidna sp.]|nr:AlpA family phage regulatory protein [Ekhidna sp.]
MTSHRGLMSVLAHSDPARVVAALLIELDGFLDEKTVEQITGLSRTERYRMRLEGTFPEMQTIKGKIKGWRVSDIQTWLDERN